MTVRVTPLELIRLYVLNLVQVLKHIIQMIMTMRVTPLELIWLLHIESSINVKTHNSRAAGSDVIPLELDVTFSY